MTPLQSVPSGEGCLMVRGDAWLCVLKSSKEISEDIENSINFTR